MTDLPQHGKDAQAFTMTTWLSTYDRPPPNLSQWIENYTYLFKVVWAHYKTTKTGAMYFGVMEEGISAGFRWMDAPEGGTFWGEFHRKLTQAAVDPAYYIEDAERQPYITIIEGWLGLATAAAEPLNYAQTIHRDEIRDVLHYVALREWIKAASALCAAFPWDKHPKGYAHWETVYNMLICKEPRMEPEDRYSLVLMAKPHTQPHLFERPGPKRIEIRSGRTVLRETK
jgi:hypothetical protein